jgi:AcrR family transcriptional regulator
VPAESSATSPAKALPATDRDVAICDATLCLLAEVGYDRMSMDAVAARAHASKATIYRRWSGKRELVLEALRTRAERHAVPADTGSLRGDLLAGLLAMSDDQGEQEAELMAGVLRAMRCSPELGACVRDHIVDGKTRLLRLIVGRAVARGELPGTADPDLAHELAVALWFQRVLVVGGPVDDAFIAHVTDDILIPLLSRVPPPSTTRETP